MREAHQIFWGEIFWAPDLGQPLLNVRMPIRDDTDTFLGGLVATVLPDVAGAPGLPELLAIALVATVLANLVNNLPATLLLVPLVAPMGGVAVLAALVGLNVGSGLTWTGSLANLLWRRIQVRAGQPPSSRAFHRYSLLVTPPAVAVAVVVLWAWDRLLTG
jgi:arsenical pump membrane protein